MRANAAPLFNIATRTRTRMTRTRVTRTRTTRTRRRQYANAAPLFNIAHVVHYICCQRGGNVTEEQIFSILQNTEKTRPKSVR